MDEIEYAEHSDSDNGSIINDYDNIKHPYIIRKNRKQSSRELSVISNDIYDFFDLIQDETSNTNILNIPPSNKSNIDNIFLDMVLFHIRNNKK